VKAVIIFTWHRHLSLGFWGLFAVKSSVEYRPCRAEHASDPVAKDGDRTILCLLNGNPVMPFAIADRVAVAQHEHCQPFIKMPPFADLFALMKNWHGNTVDRARERSIGQVAHGIIHRRIPSEPKRLCIMPPPQGIGGIAAHADGARGLVNTSRVGKGFDKAQLPVGDPTIMSIAQRDRPKFAKIKSFIVLIISRRGGVLAKIGVIRFHLQI
jgi:hypothetical protein